MDLRTRIARTYMVYTLLVRSLDSFRKNHEYRVRQCRLRENSEEIRAGYFRVDAANDRIVCKIAAVLARFLLARARVGEAPRLPAFSNNDKPRHIRSDYYSEMHFRECIATGIRRTNARKVILADPKAGFLILRLPSSFYSRRDALLKN